MFDKASPQKQQLIIDAALCEFAECGYLNASTNRIVASANISKGSLFKYFNNKQSLYIYLLNYCHRQMLTYLKRHTVSGGHWKTRYLAYAQLEWRMFKEMPLTSAFIKQAYADLKIHSDMTITAVFNKAFSEQIAYFIQTIGLNPADNQLLIDHLLFFSIGFKEQYLTPKTPKENDFLDEPKYLKRLKCHLALLPNESEAHNG